MKIGVIGCGNMGGGMVRTLLAGGMDVICFDPAPDIRVNMAGLGAAVTKDTGELAAQSEVIILSLPKAEVVRNVMSDIAPQIPKGAIILDTSTSTPATTQDMAAMGVAQGFHFIDGPVSGGPAAANSGKMTMLLGGDNDAKTTLRPILDLLTAKTVNVGASGAGHAAKIANNMLCAANLVLVSEAVRMGQAAGVSPQDLLEGINAGSGRSGVSEVNFPKWILNDAFDSGFTMGLMRKDVGLAMDLAHTVGADISGFAGLADIWLNQSGDIADNADFNEITKYNALD